MVASAAPWWREYSDHAPRTYDSVRAPLHGEFARVAKAFSERCGLGTRSVLETATLRAVKDWATLGYLTGDTIEDLRWLLGHLVVESSRALVGAALEIAKPDCNATYARDLLASVPIGEG